MKWICSFDGACEPRNPGGNMGIGWVINGKPDGYTIKAHPFNTNNRAEYLALGKILSLALQNSSVDELDVSGDSTLVVNGAKCLWKIRAPHLVPIQKRILQKLRALRGRDCVVRIKWVPRDLNQEADRASKKGIDLWM